MEKSAAKTQAIISTINQRRKKSLFRFVGVIVLASLLGAGGFAMVVAGGISEGTLQIVFLAIGFPLFFLGGVLALAAAKISSSYKRYYCEEVIGDFREGYASLTYSYKANADDLKRKLAKSSCKITFDDEDAGFYEGTLGNGDAFYSFLSRRTIKKDGHPTNIYGRYVEYHLSDEHALFILSPREGKAFFRSPSSSVKGETESLAFNEKYVAGASSVDGIFEFLSPSAVLFFAESPLTFSLLVEGHSACVYEEGVLVPDKIGLSHEPNEESILALEGEASSFRKLYQLLF